MSERVLLSLFDFSGSWSFPYREAGARVIQVDKKLGSDVLLFDYRDLERVDGILAAPPCTDYSVSGAQYWDQKDRDGRTARSNELIRRTLEIVDYWERRGLSFWCLENPVGRLDYLFPALRGKRLLMFDPCEFGDPYTKRTVLWGRFSPFLVRRFVKPERVSSQGSYLQRLGGTYEKTKEIRSLTPPGFARAFFEANPL